MKFKMKSTENEISLTKSDAELSHLDLNMIESEEGTTIDTKLKNEKLKEWLLLNPFFLSWKTTYYHIILLFSFIFYIICYTRPWYSINSIATLAIMGATDFIELSSLEALISDLVSYIPVILSITALILIIKNKNVKILSIISGFVLMIYWIVNYAIFSLGMLAGSVSNSITGAISDAIGNSAIGDALRIEASLNFNYYLSVFFILTIIIIAIKFPEKRIKQNDAYITIKKLFSQNLYNLFVKCLNILLLIILLFKPFVKFSPNILKFINFSTATNDICTLAIQKLSEQFPNGQIYTQFVKVLSDSLNQINFFITTFMFFINILLKIIPIVMIIVYLIKNWKKDELIKFNKFTIIYILSTLGLVSLFIKAFDDMLTVTWYFYFCAFIAVILFALHLFANIKMKQFSNKQVEANIGGTVVESDYDISNNSDGNISNNKEINISTDEWKSFNNLAEFISKGLAFLEVVRDKMFYYIKKFISLVTTHKKIAISVFSSVVAIVLAFGIVSYIGSVPPSNNQMTHKVLQELLLNEKTSNIIFGDIIAEGSQRKINFELEIDNDGYVEKQNLTLIYEQVKNKWKYVKINSNGAKVCTATKGVEETKIVEDLQSLFNSSAELKNAKWKLVDDKIQVANNDLSHGTYAINVSFTISNEIVDVKGDAILNYKFQNTKWELEQSSTINKTQINFKSGMELKKSLEDIKNILVNKPIQVNGIKFDIKNDNTVFSNDISTSYYDGFTHGNLEESITTKNDSYEASGKVILHYDFSDGQWKYDANNQKFDLSLKPLKPISNSMVLNSILNQELDTNLYKISLEKKYLKNFTITKNEIIKNGDIYECNVLANITYDDNVFTTSGQMLVNYQFLENQWKFSSAKAVNIKQSLGNAFKKNYRGSYSIDTQLHSTAGILKDKGNISLDFKGINDNGEIYGNMLIELSKYYGSANTQILVSYQSSLSDAELVFTNRGFEADLSGLFGNQSFLISAMSESFSMLDSGMRIEGTLNLTGKLNGNMGDETECEMVISCQ